MEQGEKEEITSPDVVIENVERIPEDDASEGSFLAGYRNWVDAKQNIWLVLFTALALLSLYMQLFNNPDAMSWWFWVFVFGISALLNWMFDVRFSTIFIVWGSVIFLILALLWWVMQRSDRIDASAETMYDRGSNNMSAQAAYRMLDKSSNAELIRIISKEPTRFSDTGEYTQHMMVAANNILNERMN